MSEHGDRGFSPDLVDKGLIVTGVIATVALILGEESIDSARPVFIGLLIIVITSLVYRTIRWFTKRRARQRASNPNPLAVQPAQDLPIDVQVVQKRIEGVLNGQTIVDHDKLFGVDAILSEIREYLVAKESYRVISLFGKGGIGKTTLAYESVRRFAVEAGFTRVAWVSIRSLNYLPSGVRQSDEAVEPLWAEILKRLADQLEFGVGFTRTTWVSDFVKAFHSLSRFERCLVIIDNIEYLEDVQKVVEFFNRHGIIGRHKLLLGTRVSARSENVKNGVTEVELIGLNTADAIAFIRHLGQGNPDIEQADNKDFDSILSVTGGNPYLIKLVIGRFFVSRLPLNMIMNELKGLKNTTPLAQEVNNYLYTKSLGQLSGAYGDADTLKFMSAFCPVGAGNAISYDVLFNYSGLQDEEKFKSILKMACNLSLVLYS
jgi:hypothetical protein